VSTVNLDFTVNNHFRDSNYEISYSDTESNHLSSKMIFLDLVQAQQMPKLVTYT
jgi:hypothetical protein